jgi:hypothetical protein
MDPLNATNSFVTSAVRATNSLAKTIKRYRERNRTLGSLLDEVKSLNELLESLKDLNDERLSKLSVLEGPVERCSTVCDAFKDAMEDFASKSKIGFLDWTKMEFMKGDINQFKESVTGYKLTISVGIGIITL